MHTDLYCIGSEVYTPSCLEFHYLRVLKNLDLNNWYSLVEIYQMKPSLLIWQECDVGIRSRS